MELKAGYKQTEVGVIPKDWECSHIGPLIDLLTGHPFPSGGYTDSGVRLLRGSNVKRGKTDWSEDLTKYWPEVSGELRKYQLVVGDIVVSMDGSLVGRSFAELEASDVPALLLQRVARVRSTYVDQSYLKTWICSKKFTDHCDSVKTTTAIPHISPADIRSFKIGLPPTKDEQSAIATALSDVDSLLAAQDALIAKKRAIKQGAMQELLTGKRRLPGFSGEWEVKSLGEVAKLSKEGIDPSATPEALFTHFSLPAFDALEAPVVEAGASIGSNKFVVPQGAVLLSKLNPRIPRVWAPNEVPSNSVCSTEFLVLVPNESVDRGFLLLACRSGHVSAQMELHAIGTTGSHQRIHPRQALKIKIPIPKDPGEQSEISKAMSDMATEITALEAQRAKTAQLKQGMMQALLTGRIRLV
ncbi:restriction endonuclease subunit S [Stenotrophomonas sp. STM01]|uniref:restriction endonuclease subunit S n=1 Tax=Stenotrophomonas sp. STM01 TaxID=2769278 RepID=UPI001786A498|nr:restriction endonuclease subunit S [Stenotrophomonas sp. STM01]MBD9537304.1 restriction endonuclease subunit S [Stenotrophomonas sp. STM01]